MDKLLELLEANGRAQPEELAKSLECSVEEVEEKIEK